MGLRAPRVLRILRQLSRTAAVKVRFKHKAGSIKAVAGFAILRS